MLKIYKEKDHNYVTLNLCSQIDQGQISTSKINLSNKDTSLLRTVFPSPITWSHVLALSFWTLNRAHIFSCQEASAQITNICIFLNKLSFPSQTIPECIRHITAVFCYNFKSKMNIHLISSYCFTLTH